MIYIFRYVIIYPLRSLLNVGELRNRERIILMPQKYFKLKVEGQIDIGLVVKYQKVFKQTQ